MNYKLLDSLIEDKKTLFYDVSDSIWCYAEPAYKETKSARLQMEVMEEQGFEIETNLAGIETAFSAKFGNSGPVIGFLGEFDALPGLSQEANATEQKALEDGGYGHGCGHNLLGSACMQAAVAVKDYIEENNIEGTVIYYGCPAEEGGAGKAFMVREGVFDNCDIAIAWHPYAITAGSMSTLANARVYYKFKGVSSHAAASPHLGRSALDSVEVMNVGVNYLREHMIPEARVHYAVTDTGGNAPNIVQADAEVLYSVRAPSNDQLVELLERVNNIARGSALINGTEVEIQVVSAYADIIQNTTLDNLAFKHITQVYPIDYTEEDIEYASQFAKIGNKTEIAMYQKFARMFYREEGDKYFKGPLADTVFPPNPQKTASTDVGDVSWNVPTTFFSGATYALGTTAHSWMAVAQGKSTIAHKGMTAAAKVMSRTAIDILHNPEIVDKANEDLKKALGGREYKSIIPEDVKPGMIK